MLRLQRHYAHEHARALAAIVWGAAGFVAWCLSWRWPPASPSDEAGLTVCALVSLLFSVGLRCAPLPAALAPPGPATRLDRELTWIGAWAGHLNMLGSMSMVAPSFASALPALLVTALVEGLLIDRAPSDWSARCRGMLNPLPPLLDAEAPTELETSNWLRSTVAGRSSDGIPYLSGWVRFELAIGQKGTHITVGFAPAFAVLPEVELDEECDRPVDLGEEERMLGGAGESSMCEARLELATPAGMRIAIKRSEAETAYQGKLLWHASAAGSDEQPPHHLALLGSQLP